MKNYAAWTPFGGSGAIILAVVMLLITGALVFFGLRLHHPLAATRPGWFLRVCIVAMLLLAIVAFLIAETFYGAAMIAQLGSDALSHTSATGPILPYTMLFALVALVVIFFLTVPSLTHAIRLGEFWGAVGSAVVGVIAAPMIFEFPFDIIVMWRTHPPSPGSLYTLLYFLPLFLIEISSFALLTFSSSLRLSRVTLYLLAGMFLTFAVWAVAASFAYPSAPLPFAFNLIAKFLAFATAVSLFLPLGDRARTRHVRDRDGAETMVQAPHAMGMV
ncbi:MAG: hypothetical protein ABI068_02745 [Ktedonobacterales bacterium]